MSSLALPGKFAESSEWLVQAIDPRARLMRLVRMDRAAYRDAAFLDDRMLPAGREARLCRLDEMSSAAERVTDPAAGWIFHIGHVGSTLVSRLLGELDGLLALREPRSLRDLAVASETERPQLAAGLRRLMARRGQGDTAVIVKATSFVSEYAPLLVEPGAAALFLHATPENYVAGILAGENSVKELQALHPVRIARLAARGIGLTGLDRTEADLAAVAWACEMTALEAAADAMTDRRIMWADFEAMLGDMPRWLGRAAQHFGLIASPGQVEQLAMGPLMRRYSKALEYDYSPSLRAELLAEARGRHLSEIDAAITALRGAATSAPLLARALERARQES